MRFVNPSVQWFLHSNVMLSCPKTWTPKKYAVHIFQVENVILEIPFPKSVLNVTLTPTQGKYSFDPVTKIMTWDVGKIDTTKLPNIRGSVSTFT